MLISMKLTLCVSIPPHSILSSSHFVFYGGEGEKNKNKKKPSDNCYQFVSSFFSHFVTYHWIYIVVSELMCSNFLRSYFSFAGRLTLCV